MKEKRLLVALGALSAALAACGSSTGDGANGATGATGAVATGTAGTTGSGASATTGGSTGTGGDSMLPPDGPCVQGIPVTTQIPRMMNRQYGNVVRDLLGVTTIDGAPVSDALIGDFTGPMTAAAWSQYQKAAAKIAADVMSGPNKSKFITCAPADAGCLKTTIETFGKKAFRRALTADEVTSFQKLSAATPAGTPDQVAEATLNAFLISPSFLLIPELSKEVEGSAIKLSQQEVATRLSFLLWGSVPDDALNMAADAGQLASKDQILAQAKRMIAVREKTGPLVSAFHSEWAQMNNSGSHWYKGDHDVTKYPTYTAAMKTTAERELDAFFEEVAFANGSFQDLLTSNVAFVNKDNAAIYGLDPAAYGTDLTKVTLDAAATPRPGFLTRAGFLSSYANYDASSPILRGAFIKAWILNTPAGAPVEGAKDAKAEGTFATQREYVTALTQQAQPCKGCHDTFNPFGYALENYDGIGKWQTQDLRGGTINAAATIDLGDGVPKDITSPVQLMQELAKFPKAQELYAKAWVSYAFGRPANANDQCVVDDLKMKVGGGGYTILSLLADLTQADSFRLRVRGTP
jgi:hypothetical protein